MKEPPSLIDFSTSRAQGADKALKFPAFMVQFILDSDRKPAENAAIDRAAIAIREVQNGAPGLLAGGNGLFVARGLRFTGAQCVVQVRRLAVVSNLRTQGTTNAG